MSITRRAAKKVYTGTQLNMILSAGYRGNFATSAFSRSHSVLEMNEMRNRIAEKPGISPALSALMTLDLHKSKQKRMQIEMREIVKEVKITAIQAVIKQQIPEFITYRKLNERYVIKKGHGDFFINTGRFVREGLTFKVEGLDVKVGVSLGDYMHGLSFNLLNKFFEYGTIKQPRRPLVSPLQKYVDKLVLAIKKERGWDA